MQALYLNCPELNDLNLNSCKNLHPGAPSDFNILTFMFFRFINQLFMLLITLFICTEKLSLICPNLEYVHASGCEELLIGAIRCQVNTQFRPPSVTSDLLVLQRIPIGRRLKPNLLSFCWTFIYSKKVVLLLTKNQPCFDNTSFFFFFSPTQGTKICYNFQYQIFLSFSFLL